MRRRIDGAKYDESCLGVVLQVSVVSGCECAVKSSGGVIEAGRVAGRDISSLPVQ